MKPLFANWVPAMVSEQPVSASEDKRVMRLLTGLALLDCALMDEEKADEQGRQILSLRCVEGTVVVQRAVTCRASRSEGQVAMNSRCLGSIFCAFC